MVNKNHQSMYELILEEVYKNGKANFILEIYPNTKYYLVLKDYIDDLRPIEKEALKLLDKKDRILDIGAGTGRVSRYLQKRKYNVTALDKTNIACKIMLKKKIKRVINSDIFNHIPFKKYDSVLFIRNYSIFGTEEKNIVKLLNFLRDKIIKKNGKLIFFLKGFDSGKTQILKRRFIFKDEVGLWLKSINLSVDEMIRLSKKSGWSALNYKKDKENNYFLILKKC